MKVWKNVWWLLAVETGYRRESYTEHDENSIFYLLSWGGRVDMAKSQLGLWDCSVNGLGGGGKTEAKPHALGTTEWFP